MTYFGIVKFTMQRVYLLIASNLVLIVLNVFLLWGWLNVAFLIGLLAFTALLYLDIVMCERKSSAALSASTFELNRAYVYGFITINREYANDANQSTLEEFTRSEAETFSSDTLDEIAHAKITFFRESAVFSENRR
ncbi:hypothetical protein [Cohnella terricola]|uniref:Uncharacterized protein n=1 Tax=Cohnella terricola TaxID=1289167 RepID=A0A559JDJ8_9BACL|nr:hypothetical protein [Cohnella terricola]TVX97948.1 hypothetical protein FPZ45_17025 [Cohnella terricola]